jgi:hypothetical protein
LLKEFNAAEEAWFKLIEDAKYGAEAVWPGRAFAVRLPAPKGQPQESPGQRPGLKTQTTSTRALKGRNKP